MTFAELEGRAVRRCVGEFHSHDGRAALLHLGIDFDDDTFVSLGCAPDGQSLEIGSEVLRERDHGEYGRIELREHDGLIPGETIEDADPLLDRDSLTFGVLLRTPRRRLFVFNWRDNLYAMEELPPLVAAHRAT